MTNRKIKALWGQEHESFALKHKLCPAAKLLWHWIIEQGELAEESEPDLKQFNNWVKKYRGAGFTRQWLKTAFDQLVECRVVQVIKQYTWNLVKIIARPLDYLKPKKAKEKLPDHDKTCDLHPSNPQSPESSPNSSSNSSEDDHKRQVLDVCAEAGINYDSDKPAEIFNYPIDEIKQAIELFATRGGHERIHNPEGWLIHCLRWKYWDKLTGNLINSLLAI